MHGSRTKRANSSYTSGCQNPTEFKCFRVNGICEGANGHQAVREVSLSQKAQALVAGYPPRGSGRALLTHPVLTLGSGVEAVHRVWVDYSGRWQPAPAQLTETFPCHSVSLTPSAQ